MTARPPAPRYTAHDYDAAWEVYDNVNRKGVSHGLTEKAAVAEATRLNAAVVPVQLLPCPHCGADPIYQHHEPHMHSAWLKAAIPNLPDHQGSHTIECAACGNGMIADARDDVMARWNRRVRITEIEGGSDATE